MTTPETTRTIRQKTHDVFGAQAGNGQCWQCPARLDHVDPGATQDINRCQTTARACALVYNWWSWYCRAASPGARMEAITSRPLLLAAVGKAASHAGQTTLYLTPMHGKAKLLKPLIANIRAALQQVKAAAERFAQADRWAVLLR